MKGAPGSLLGGRLGAVAPPASFNVQEVPADPERVATPVRARVMEGGGMVCGVFGWWEVGGGGGEVRWFCGDGFEMVVRGCVVFERVVFEGGGE